MPTNLNPYPICPACHTPVDHLDNFPVVDGSHWHVLCYQAAFVNAGQPDPFPECYDCEQLVWETQPVVTPGLNDTVRYWHPECAPGSPSRGRVEDDPPPSERAIAVEAKRRKGSVNGKEAPTTPSTTATHAPTAPSPSPSPTDDEIASMPVGDAITALNKTHCAYCLKRVAKGAVKLEDEKIAHPRCHEREKKKLLKEAKKRVRDKAVNAEIAKEGVTVDAPSTSTSQPALPGVEAEIERPKRAKRVAKEKPVLPICPYCSKKITSATVEEKIVRCEPYPDGRQDIYHKTCYRKAVMASGAPDPFPKVKKVKLLTIRCAICNTKVPRDDVPEKGLLGFRSHFAQHEKELASAQEKAREELEQFAGEA